jgi:hypothetical protein
MANERFVIGIIFACLAPSPAKSLAEPIEHEENIPAGAGWHNRWHTQTPLDWIPETLTQGLSLHDRHASRSELTYRVSKNGRHQTPTLAQMGNDVVDEAP